MDPLKPYLKLYTSNKKRLFPIMEKYSGESLEKTTHAVAASLYSDLLLNDENFKAEVDQLIIDLGYKNSIGNIVTGIASLFGDSEDKEAILYQAVLEQQRRTNTTTILIVSAVTVALLVAGTILVIKMKKQS